MHMHASQHTLPCVLHWRYSRTVQHVMLQHHAGHAPEHGTSLQQQLLTSDLITLHVYAD